MKTRDAYNGSRRMGERFLRLWSELAQSTPEGLTLLVE